MPDTGSFYCFVEGIGGNAINFICHMENLGYFGAVEKLCEEYNIELSNDPKYHQSKNKCKENIQTQKTLVRNINTVIDYLKIKRGLSDNTIKELGIGYDAIGNVPLSGQGAEEKGFTFKGITFPIFDNYDRLVAFAKRRLPGDEVSKKYINTYDWDLYKKSELLYGINHARRMIKKANGRLVVCEGYLDFASLYEQGEAAVAYCFGHLTKEQILQIKQLLENNPTHEIILACDMDATGIDEITKARQKFQQYFPKANIRVPIIPEGYKDVNDLHVAKKVLKDLETEQIDKYVAKLLLSKVETKESQFATIEQYLYSVKSELIKYDILSYLSETWGMPIDVLKKQFSVVQDGKDDKLKRIHGMDSCIRDYDESLKSEKEGIGFPNIDNTINGTRRKEAITIAGYSSSGKSTIAAKVIVHKVLREKKRCAVFSMEEPRGQFMEHLACEALGINPYKLAEFRKTNGDEMYNKVKDVFDRYVRIVDDSNIDMKSIIEYTELMNKYEFDEPVGFMVLDHFHLIPGIDDIAVCTENANMIKNYVKEFNLTALILAQFNEESQKMSKMGKWREPTMGDIKGGNALKAIMDTIILAWRPYYVRLDIDDIDREKLKYRTDMKVAKNRRGVKEGIYFSYDYDPETTRFIPK